MSDQTADDAAPADGPPADTPAPAAPAPASRSEGPDKRVNRRKVREGTVVSNKMDKTVVVAVIDRVSHPRYFKTVQRTKRVYAHDEDNGAQIGDRVRVQEIRPLSKLKRWRVVEVLERAR